MCDDCRARAEHPFFAASLWVEALKFAGKPRTAYQASDNELASDLEGLLREVELDALTGRELADALKPIALSFQAQLGIPRALAYSIFADGVMHGIAYAKGLRGQLPELTR